MTKIIIASRNGIVGRFAERAWELGRMPKEGWQITSRQNVDETGDEIIPVTDVEIDDIPLESLSESDRSTEEKVKPTEEENAVAEAMEKKKSLKEEVAEKQLELDAINKAISDAKALPKNPSHLKGTKGKYTKVVTENVEQNEKAEMKMMRTFLRKKGLKPHNLLGYKKLKTMYDENTK